MPKTVKSIDDIRVDLFEALKRAYMRRGYMAKPGKKPQVQAETSINQASSEGEGTEHLVDLAEKSHDVLFEADTVFPFTMFPDTVTLDREKLTVATRTFFWTAKIISVPVGAILSAEADVGPFFGSVQMTSKYFVRNSYSVNFLWRRDAVELQRLLQGYIIAHERKVDCTTISIEDLKTLLNDLGQGVSD